MFGGETGFAGKISGNFMGNVFGNALDFILK